LNEEFKVWIEEKGLEWTESLPYTGLPGWTDGRFSVIEGENMDLEETKRRYECVYTHIY